MDFLTRMRRPKLEYDFKSRTGIFSYAGTPDQECPIEPAKLLAMFRTIDPEVKSISTRCFVGNTMEPLWDGSGWRNAHGKVKFDGLTLALVEDEQ